MHPPYNTHIHSISNTLTDTHSSTQQTVILCSMSPPCLVTFPSCLPHCLSLFLLCAPSVVPSSPLPSLHPINNCWHFLPQLRKKQLKAIDLGAHTHSYADAPAPHTYTRLCALVHARPGPWICKWVSLTFKGRGKARWLHSSWDCHWICQSAPSNHTLTLPCKGKVWRMHMYVWHMQTFSTHPQKRTTTRPWGAFPSALKRWPVATHPKWVQRWRNLMTKLTKFIRKLKS